MKIDIITENTLIIPEYIIDIKNRSKNHRNNNSFQRIKKS